MNISNLNLKERRDYFVKEVNGEGGKFVKYIKDYNDLNSYMREIEGVNVIFQEKIKQHDKMELLNGNSVNSLRVITANINGNTNVFAVLCRIGTHDSAERDNTCQGGIAVGVNSDGTLMEYGVRKPQFGGRVRIHPDSGVEFSTFEIPFYKEALNLACKAHQLFPDIRSIGWDIAISESGPMFIEGNDNWEIQTIQAIYGGQRNRLMKLWKGTIS